MQSVLTTILTILIGFSAFVIPAPSATATVILDVQGGVLFGARNVDVAGTLYYVEFLDGTCVGVFGDCDETPSFQFTDLISSTGAAQALLDQVFLDSAAGHFDSHPELIRGCSFVSVCFVDIPYHSARINTELLAYDIRTVANGSPTLFGSDHLVGDPLSPNTSTDSNQNTFGVVQTTWAKFSQGSPIPVPVPVPEPGTLFLDVQGGILYGARNVDVAGTLYDVEFLDGTCVGVFGDCDETPSFQFADLNSAENAARALLDQVFLDSSAGQFDSHTELIRGCSFVIICSAYIPYHSARINSENFVYDLWDVANPSASNNYLLSHGIDSNQNTFGLVQTTWAKFSLASPVPVPETGTLSLFLSAGLVLVAMRGRQSRV
ncbi:MAG: hypothetical protein ABL951_15995 [Alphaproteobacteria bacterium]